nr:hypothetical protein [Tanacetum cinerariifolium]
EFADDTITDYTRPSSSVESNPKDLQNNSSSASKNRESTGSILSKPEIKFVKPADSLTIVKTDKKETVRKSTVKYAELYRKPSKKSTVRGNQRNWNNLKSQQLDENFIMKNKACFNCGHFDHLSYDCGIGVKKGRTSIGLASEGTATKKGRTVALTTEDMQKRKNDVKARTTLLLTLPDEHQLQFSKYKTTQELWAAILKTFGAKHSSGNEEVNTASIPTASTNVYPASANIGAASISQDTACAYIASQYNGRVNSKVVLAFTSFFLFCMSSVVNATVLPFFVAVPSLAKPMAATVSNPLSSGIFSLQQGELSSLAVGTSSGTTKVIVKVPKPRKKRGVIIQDPKETTTIVSMQPKVQAKDKGKAILIEEPKPLKRQVQIDLDEERKPLTEAQARRNMIVYLKNMTGYKMNYFKGMSYDKIRPLFEKHYNYNQAFLKEVKKVIKVPEKEVRKEKEVEVESSKREGESLEQEIAKKQKMEQETEELKKRLQIIPDDDDDVYADATPLALKISIVDYKIHTKRNKPYFKMIRADRNDRLFMSFSKMMKNFDRKDLESLWKIVRERFEKTKPKNYTYDYLLNTLKIKFEKHNMFLLIEKMYPLTHFTLEEMVNDVRLEVDYESEMSLELLRLVRGQLNEGVLVNKSQNKTLYELFIGRTPPIGFLKSFDFHVMILNTLDYFGKFEAKGDECYFIGYFMSSKAFRVFNKRTKRVEENLHVDFLENKAIEKGAGPNWLFDIDSLTNSMNYVPVVVIGTKEAAGQDMKKDVSSLRYIVLLNWVHDAHLEFSTNTSSGNSNPIATSTNPSADHMETLAVETPIPTVLKNKKDGRGKVIKNKARLVAQGHTQEEGIDYDEVFALVARIEAIRLFLAYALFMGFTVYQMDVKSAFLYGTIDEKVGTIDQTLFIRRHRGDFILVQVYVDDIIFGSSNPQLCREFEALMHEKFQMSAMEDILKKFRYSDIRSSNTPMDKENPWGKGRTRKDVDLHLYRSMIGSLMYLTASRPDIILFKHVVSIFPELAIDHYLLCDRVMHPLAPHYERKTRSDHGKKRPHKSNASFSSTTPNHPSSSLPLDAIIDENDKEPFHSNSSSLSQK